MSTKAPKPNPRVFSEISALRAAIADIELSGLSLTAAQKKRVFQAVKDKDTTTEQLIAEFELHLN